MAPRQNYHFTSTGSTNKKIIKQIMKQEKKGRERVIESLKLNHLFPDAPKQLRMSKKLEKAGKRK
jgi:sulfur relay (sulfurtransferase) DsrC/TusE family protein